MILFLYLSMDFWYGCSGRQVLVYLGVPDSAVVLIQRSKTVPSNEKTFWEFEKNVSENNMEKESRKRILIFYKNFIMPHGNGIAEFGVCSVSQVVFDLPNLNWKTVARFVHRWREENEEKVSTRGTVEAIFSSDQKDENGWYRYVD